MISFEGKKRVSQPLPSLLECTSAPGGPELSAGVSDKKQVEATVHLCIGPGRDDDNGPLSAVPTRASRADSIWDAWCLEAPFSAGSVDG